MSNLFNTPLTDNVQSAALANPFFDQSTKYMPRNMEDVLVWAEYLWCTHGTYRAALQRIIRYFITDIHIEGTDDTKEITKYKDMLVRDFQILTTLTNVGDDMISVGNSFTSLYVPLDRRLTCEVCKTTTPIAKIDFEFKDYEFTGKCDSVKCGGKAVKFTHKDTTSMDLTRFKVIRWNPHDIKLKYNMVSGDSEYYWVIPSDVKDSVMKGDQFVMSTVNWEIVECVKSDSDFRFNKGMLKHIKETTISSVRSNGWGIPKSLSVLKQAWYLQMLHRQNEAIASDYMLPFRVISPAAGPGAAQDPLLSMNMGGFMGQVKAMIALHRKDPATYHTSPVPLQFQALGTDGATMATPQLIQNAVNKLLNELGVPEELFTGNLRVVGSPLALRLFERMHSDVASALNDWLRWLVTQLSDALSWDDVTCRMRSPTIAEDLDLKNLMLQLQSANIVSKETALSIWGIDSKTEFAKVLAEQREEAEMQAAAQRNDAPKTEVQQIMDMNVQQRRQDQLIEQGVIPNPEEQQGGAPGGAPQQGQSANLAEAVSGGDKSIYDMDTQAQDTAQQLLSMPESQRRSQMIGLKKSDEAFHALVKSKMESMRQEASLIGRDQVLAQQLPPA